MRGGGGGVRPMVMAIPVTAAMTSTSTMATWRNRRRSAGLACTCGMTHARWIHPKTPRMITPMVLATMINP